MFTSVQPLQRDMHQKSKKGTLVAGMTLVKEERMIKRFTYKEAMLVFGIIVAIVIVYAVWLTNEVGGESVLPSLKPKMETSSITGFTNKVVSQIVALTIR